MIRHSFIATRSHGVETYRFPYDCRSFRIVPDGRYFIALVGDYSIIERGPRVDCVSAIMETAGYTV